MSHSSVEQKVIDLCISEGDRRMVCAVCGKDHTDSEPNVVCCGENSGHFVPEYRLKNFVYRSHLDEVEAL